MRLDIDAEIRNAPTSRVQLSQPESDLEVPLPARARREVERIEPRSPPPSWLPHRHATRRRVPRVLASYWALADSANITLPYRGRSADDNELMRHEASASVDRRGHTAEVQQRVAPSSVSAARSQRPTRHGPRRFDLNRSQNCFSWIQGASD